MYTSKKGILYNKINYRKYGKVNKQPEESKEPNDQLPLQNVTDLMEKMTVDEELTYLLFFKTCLIERDKEILKIKMKQSIALREKVLRKAETKFAESFPFYFISPDLVNIV